MNFSVVNAPFVADNIVSVWLTQHLFALLAIENESNAKNYISQTLAAKIFL